MSDFEMLLERASQMEILELEHYSNPLSASQISQIGEWWNKLCDADDFLITLALTGNLDDPL